MRELLKVLNALEDSLAKPFDQNSDLTISDYPELAKLALAVSMMQRCPNKPEKFKQHLNTALKWANEILKPKMQDSYAFTSSSWYQEARCNQTISSMLLTLNAIKMQLDQPIPGTQTATNVAEPESKDNREFPRPGFYT